MSSGLDPQVQRLSAHAKTLGKEQIALRIGIVHTYTSDLLDPWLDMSAALQGIKVQTYHAPYGVIVQETGPGSGLVAHQPDITMLMLRREDLHPALANSVVGLDREAQTRLRADALAQLRNFVERFRAQKVGQLVLTLLPALVERALGQYDAQAELSEAAWWAVFKSDLGHWLRESVASSLFLDLDEVLLQVGRQAFFDRRYWYTAQFPFAPEAARVIV